jgi:hypothetical protein
MASAYPTVRRQLVSIVEATTVDHDTTFSGDAPFRELESGWADDEHALPPTRSFVLELGSGAVQLPMNYKNKGRMRAQCTLMVFYADDTFDAVALDETVGSDAENLAAQLLGPSNWDRANSGIELVGRRDGGHEALKFDIIAGDGVRVLEFAFDVVYNRGIETNTP